MGCLRRPGLCRVARFKAEEAGAQPQTWNLPGASEILTLPVLAVLTGSLYSHFPQPSAPGNHHSDLCVKVQ